MWYNESMETSKRKLNMQIREHRQYGTDAGVFVAYTFKSLREGYEETFPTIFDTREEAEAFDSYYFYQLGPKAEFDVEEIEIGDQNYWIKTATLSYDEAKKYKARVISGELLPEPESSIVQQVNISRQKGNLGRCKKILWRGAIGLTANECEVLDGVMKSESLYSRYEAIKHLIHEYSKNMQKGKR